MEALNGPDRKEDTGKAVAPQSSFTPQAPVSCFSSLLASDLGEDYVQTAQAIGLAGCFSCVFKFSATEAPCHTFYCPCLWHARVEYS